MAPGRSQWQAERRGRHEMVASVLSICKQPVNRNRIMHAGNFSSHTTRSYLELVLKAGLVELVKDGTIVTTAKGIAYLERYDSLQNMLA